MSTLERFLPAFNYYLDESDPDVMILRCQDGSFVAAFSPDGATNEGIIEAAKEHNGNASRIIGPGEASALLRNIAALNSSTKAYSPEYLEEKFSELRLYRILGSSFVGRSRKSGAAQNSSRIHRRPLKCGPRAVGTLALRGE